MIKFLIELGYPDLGSVDHRSMVTRCGMDRGGERGDDGSRV